MHTIIDKSGSSQDCVVLAFTGRQMKVFCSLPNQNNPVVDMDSLKAPVMPYKDNPDATFSACIADINQNAEIISEKLGELRELVHEFANVIRQYED